MPAPTEAPNKPDRYNPGDLHAAEQFPEAYASHGVDQLGAYANDPSNRTTNKPQDTPPPTANIDDAKQREQDAGDDHRVKVSRTPGGGSTKQKRSFWRRFAPSAALGGGIFGGGAIAMFFGGSGILPFNIDALFTNDTNDMNYSVEQKHIGMMGGKLGKEVRNKIAFCNAGVSFRCQFKTLSAEAAQKYKDAGFEFGDEVKSDDGKRVAFSTIKFPPEVGGETAGNVRQLERILRSNLGAYGAWNSRYSATRAIFFGDFFRGVLGHLNLTKLKKIEGTTREQTEESYKTAIETGEKLEIDASSVSKEVEEGADEAERAAAEAANSTGNETAQAINSAIAAGQKVQSVSLKGTNNPALLAAQLTCLTYNMTALISTSAKAIKIARYAAFAMAILTTIAAMKVGDATAAEAATATDILAPSEFPDQVEDPETGNMIDNPNIGKNATDSEAYQVVAYGDSIDLSDLAKRFFLTGGILGVLQTVISWINEHIGKQTVKTTCDIANSQIVNILSFLAAPVFSAVMLGITAILPLEEWAGALVNNAIEAVAGANITTDIKGVDAGNLLFIGTASIMGQSAMNFGLKPGAYENIRENMQANYNLHETQIAAEYEKAKTTPFDVSNPYSFMGSLRQKLQPYLPSEGSSFASSIGNVFSMLPGALTSISTPSHAAFNQPVANYPEKRFSQCPDTTYEEMGVSPDMFCVLRFVPFEPSDLDPVLDYMADRGQLEDSGEAKSGNQYAKYLKYCVKRTEPWGSTATPIEEQEDGLEWYTGTKCLEDTQENRMFSEYRGYHVSVKNFEEVIQLSPDQTETVMSGSITDAMIAGYNYITNTDTSIGQTQGAQYAQ